MFCFCAAIENECVYSQVQSCLDGARDYLQPWADSFMLVLLGANVPHGWGIGLDEVWFDGAELDRAGLDG